MVRFGRLTARTPTQLRSGGKVVWECLCDCGTLCTAASNHLSDGRRVSCGCAKLAGHQLIAKTPRHGHYVGNKPSPTYVSWSSMNSRCNNLNVPDFHRYGGRGISICDRWKDFALFLEDMGERPLGTSLDRKDVNGNYLQDNCTWSTPAQQSRNTRTNRWLCAFGKRQVLKDWCIEFSIPQKTITDRLGRGLTLEQAIALGSNQSARIL